jgi:hypothetical protein
MADEFETWLHQLNEDFVASTTVSLDIEATLAIVKRRADTDLPAVQPVLAANARGRDAVAATNERRVLAGGQRATPQPLEEPGENIAPLPSLLRHPLARHRARQLERARQARDQLLAGRVQDILFGRGLTQIAFSIGGGRTIYVPQVVSVIAGPPVGLDIRTLPGQTPDDFAKHAPAIAYNLGVAEVRVVPLGPSLIRLELLDEPG